MLALRPTLRPFDSFTVIFVDFLSVHKEGMSVTIRLVPTCRPGPWEFVGRSGMKPDRQDPSPTNILDLTKI